MRNFLFLFLFCFSFPVLGQEFCHVGLSSKEYVLDEFKNNQENDTAFTYSYVETDSTLFVTIDGAEKIEVDYYFGKDSLCDRQVCRYYCCECADKHQHKILKREFKFKQGNDGKYYSKFEMHTCAIVTNPGLAPCVMIEFYRNNLTKQEYKKKF
jgi:hypothetical protein